MVAVVGLTVALHAKEVDTGFLVLAHHAGVHVRTNVVGAMLREGGGVRYIEEVAHGLFRDDIHHARYRIRAKQRTAAAADNLYPVHHPRRHLLQPIDRRKRREDRTRVQQYLRVLSF